MTAGGALVHLRVQCRACGTHTPVSPARYVRALALDVAGDLEGVAEALRGASIARDAEAVGGCLTQLRRIVARLRGLGGTPA